MRSALRAYACTGKPSLYELVMKRCHATRFFQGKLKSRMFEWPLSQEQIQGEISIGKIIDTDWVYRVGMDDLTRHVFCAGAPGQGKTVFLNNLLLSVVRAGHQVVCLDPKGGDFNGLIPEGVLYIPWHELRFNLLRPPEGVPLNRWVPRLAEALSEPLGLLIASLGTLEGYLEKTYARWSGKVFPCFRELSDEVKKEGRSFGKAGMYRDTVENRMDTVNHTLSEVLWCRRGYMDELMHQSFILDISNLIGVAQNILVESLMAFIYTWHMANVPNDRPQRLVRGMVVDESQHSVLAVNKAKSARTSAAGMESRSPWAGRRGWRTSLRPSPLPRSCPR